MTLTVALSLCVASSLAHAEPLAINDKEYFAKRRLEPCEAPYGSP